MEERREFVRLASAEGANVRQLCRRFGISPTTGYKWLARAASGGELRELPRRPHRSPERVSASVEAAVLAVRRAHPAWGGRKIRARLQRQGMAAAPAAPVPAASTVTAILRRNGEAVGALAGRQVLQRFEHAAPNALWQMDFKGHVGLGDGRRLHPLTVLDDHSRYAVVLRACADQTTATVRAALIDAFRRHGLPGAIITDNGAPWGDGPGHPWTPLGVFLIEQGIRIAHSRPYHPQTMGKDERFHRSLKAEVLAGPPFADLAAADRRFAEWRHVYNSERPHQALAMAVPAERYSPSRRDYREAVPPFDYADDDIVRIVQQGGRTGFMGRILRLPKAFRGHRVAFRPTARDGCFEVYFRTQRIAEIDLKSDNDTP
jgi:transposase InsO family protein